MTHWQLNLIHIAVYFEIPLEEKNAILKGNLK